MESRKAMEEEEEESVNNDEDEMEEGSVSDSLESTTLQVANLKLKI